MTYHEPTRTVPVSEPEKWLIYSRDGGQSWFAKMLKYDSDTGPFPTFEQARDFTELRGQ